MGASLGPAAEAMGKLPGQLIQMQQAKAEVANKKEENTLIKSQAENQSANAESAKVQKEYMTEQLRQLKLNAPGKENEAAYQTKLKEAGAGAKIVDRILGTVFGKK